MSRVLAGMSMSLDGYVAGPDDEVEPLYEGFDAESPAMRETIARTGAVLMGRNTYEMGDPDAYAEVYEFQVPIFVVTSTPPTRTPASNERLSFTFEADPLAALEAARAAAGERDVTVVGGPTLIQALVLAGVVDELEVDLVPVFLGGGLRLFEDPELANVPVSGPRTTIRCRPRTGP